MPKIYFVSDIHLGLGSKIEERIKEDRFIGFLDSIKKDAEQLFIVGDLFDAWIEYRNVIPKGFHRTLAKLDEMVQSGISLHFLVGNHDCWVRDYFSEIIGMKVYLEPFQVQIQGKKIYLHHGDGHSKNDIGYSILKKIVRHPLSIWFFSWLHPDIGLRLARSSSKTSRQYTSQKHYGEGDGMTEFAEQKIKDGNDYVIMGHRHIPSVNNLAAGIYINLGDWINNGMYAVIEEGKISLREWKSKQE